MNYDELVPISMTSQSLYHVLIQDDYTEEFLQAVPHMRLLDCLLTVHGLLSNHDAVVFLFRVGGAKAAQMGAYGFHQAFSRAEIDHVGAVRFNLMRQHLYLGIIRNLDGHIRKARGEGQ